MNISDLIEQLIDARTEVRRIEDEQEVAFQEYRKGGGRDWGWAGREYFAEQENAEEKVRNIKNKIDAALQTPKP